MNGQLRRACALGRAAGAPTCRSCMAPLAHGRHHARQVRFSRGYGVRVADVLPHALPLHAACGRAGIAHWALLPSSAPRRPQYTAWPVLVRSARRASPE